MALHEIYASRELSYSARQISGVRKFWCDQDEVQSVKPNIGDPFPGEPLCRCADVAIAWNFGTADETYGATQAEISATYSSNYVDVDITEQLGYIEESLEFGGEMIERFGGVWKDCETPVAKKDIGGLWYPRLKYVVTIVAGNVNEWVRKVKDYTGKVNSSQWMGGAKHKWLLEGASANDFYTKTGIKRWHITFVFMFRGGGINWNQLYHSEHKGGAKWEEIMFLPVDFDPPASGSNAADYTDRIYKEANFSELLQFRPAVHYPVRISEISQGQEIVVVGGRPTP